MKRTLTTSLCLILAASTCWAIGPKKGFGFSPSPLNETRVSGKDTKISESAHFIHLGGVVPFSNFMAGAYLSPPGSYGFGPSLDFGSLFSIVDFGPGDNFAFGIRVTYLKASYMPRFWSDTSGTHTLIGSMIHLGPYFTFGFTDEMGVDVYYQAAPSYLAELIYGKGFSYFGATHSIGLSWRYQILSLGFEFNLGSYPNIDDSYGKPAKGYQAVTDHFRFFIGVAM